MLQHSATTHETSPNPGDRHHEGAPDDLGQGRDISIVFTETEVDDLVHPP